MSSRHRASVDAERSRQRVEQKDETPELYSIFCGEVASIQSYGAFVKIPGYRKNGLVHKTQISAARIEDVSEVLSVGDRVFCKVISLGEEDNVKISLSMKVVDQGSGKDLDANLVQTKQEEQRRKKGQTFVQPKIELGAVFNTICRKCGTKGHLAKDCFQMPGSKTYDLVTEEDLTLPVDIHEPASSSSAHKKKKKKKEKKRKKSKKHRHRSVSSDSSDSESDSSSDRHRHKHPHKHHHTSKEVKEKSKRHQRHRSPSSNSSDSSSSSDRHRHKHRHTSTGRNDNPRKSGDSSDKHMRKRHKNYSSDDSSSSDEYPHKHSHRHRQRSGEGSHRSQSSRESHVDLRRAEHKSIPGSRHSNPRLDHHEGAHEHRHGNSKPRHR